MSQQAFKGAEHIRSSQPMHPPVAPVWPVAPVKPAEEGGHISTGTRLQQVPTHYRGVQAVSVHDRLVQRVGFTCSPEVLIHSAHRLRSACRPTCGACLAACTGEACAEETHHPRGLPVTHSGPVSWHELTVYTPHRLRRWAARAWASKHSEEQTTSGRVSPCTHPWRLSGLWRQ